MAQKRLTRPAAARNLRDRAVLKNKHQGKRRAQITQADVLEWARQEMMAALDIPE